jgi:dTDP-L-rhamnose 4-epimerase
VAAVVHFAAETGAGQSMYEIDRYYRINVQGTALMLYILASRTLGVTALVAGSSRSVYGEDAYRCDTCDSCDGGQGGPLPAAPRPGSSRSP